MSAADDLWTWAVAAYGREGVSEACLELQDVHGQTVPLLLWTAWAAGSGRALDDDAIEGAIDVARVWDQTAVSPLRAIRRALKVPLIDMDPEGREAVRARVKATELEAERRLLIGLAALAPEASGPPRPALPDLLRVARAWGGAIPRPALTRLVERLGS